MFKIGERVVVIGSNATGGKTKVKIGSYGFISQENNNEIFLTSDIYANEVNVVFNRYGYELTSDRCEAKKVVALIYIPNMVGNTKVDEKLPSAAIKSEIDGFLNRLSKSDSSKMPWSAVRNFTDCKEFVVLSRAPGQPSSLKDKKEFSAWIYAITASNTFIAMVHNFMHNIGNFKNYATSGHIKSLYNIAFHNEGWFDRLEKIKTSEAEKEEVIEVVTKMFSIHDHNNYKNDIQTIRSIFSDGGLRPRNDAVRFYNNLLRFIGNDSTFEYCGKLIQKASVNGAIDSILGFKKTETVKNYLEFLAPKFLSNKV